MTELEYRNRSISQLVSELNSLGEAKVVLEPIRLLAVHEYDMENVKRFKNSHGEQFFSQKGNDKKYVYTEIVQKIASGQFRLLMDIFERGFNISVMVSLPREQDKITSLLSEVVKWMGDAAYSAVFLGQQQIMDMIGETKLTQRDLEGQLKFYRVKEVNALVFMDKIVRSQAKSGVTLLKIRKIVNDQVTPNQLNLIILPEQFFSPANKSSDYLSIVKSQLTQIFNYIKLNPAKKYQHFSKLLTKRLPATNAIASLVLEKSLCMVVNWINEGSSDCLGERLAFYEKIRGLSAFLKIEENCKPIILDLPFQYNSNTASRKQLQKNRQLKQAKTDRTPIAHLLSNENELQYCRSLQRKTHKYSITNEVEEGEQLFSYKQNNYEEPSQFVLGNNNNSLSPVTHHRSQRLKDKTAETRRFDQTLPKNVGQHLKQSEQIAILKANHAVQISQYHQTIQQLNRKILALAQENNLEELYSVHQREIMLLELKIKQLRNDISVLCQESDQKSYKSIVRKLNEEIKRLQSKNAEQKLVNGKSLVLQKQLQGLRKKYDESESTRNKLAFQLEHLTKRLKICDAEIEHLTNKEVNFNQGQSNQAQSPISTNKLSINDAQRLKEVEVLVQNIKEGSEQASKFLVRKITNILEDLASSRNLILDCNDFLVQLQEHLEEKLGNKQPQIVLDCNKFIRNFLMDNLNVF